MSEFISLFILKSEYVCAHCGKLPPAMVRGEDGEWPLIFQYGFSRFAAIREAWGKPISITSGYRCPDHPLHWGTHTFGLALDCAIGVDEMTTFGALIDDVAPELRVGTNRKPGHVHVHLDWGFLISPIYSEFLREGLRFEE